jgi:hypothetical protein
MKIVFKPQTEEDKDDLIRSLAASEIVCPEDFGLEQNCDLICTECWKAAFETAEKNGEWNRCSQHPAPKEGRPVLVTMLDYKNERFVAETLDKRATLDNKVIAWQYPPGVYRGEA